MRFPIGVSRIGVHDPIEQHGAIGDAARLAHPQPHDQRPVIQPGRRRGLVAKAAQHLPDRAGDRRGRQRALDDRAAFADMTVHHEAALGRVHRALDALDRMRQPIVEHQQPVEARLDGLVEAAPGLRLGQVAAEGIGFAAHQRLAAQRAAQIPGQRIDKAEPPVQRIVVPALAAARDIKAEIGPGDVCHAERRDRPATQRLVECRGPFVADHLLGAGAQIGVELRHKPVVPDLVGFRPVRLRVGEMLVDRAAHLQRQFGRQKAVRDDQWRAWHSTPRQRRRMAVISAFPPILSFSGRIIDRRKGGPMPRRTPDPSPTTLLALSLNSLLCSGILDRRFRMTLAECTDFSIKLRRNSPVARGASSERERGAARFRRWSRLLGLGSVIAAVAAPSAAVNARGIGVRAHQTHRLLGPGPRRFAV